MKLEYIRSEIARLRVQIRAQRFDIRRLEHAGINSTSARALLDRMENRVDELSVERDRLKCTGKNLKAETTP